MVESGDYMSGTLIPWLNPQIHTAQTPAPSDVTSARCQRQCQGCFGFVFVVERNLWTKFFCIIGHENMSLCQETDGAVKVPFTSIEHTPGG